MSNYYRNLHHIEIQQLENELHANKIKTKLR